MWTLELGIAAARIIQAVVVEHGAHVALSGSVLIRGESKKDLDIVIYPHDADKGYNVYAIQHALRTEFCNWFKCGSTADYVRDSKEVWTTYYYGARVDFFFLMSEGKKEL